MNTVAGKSWVKLAFACLAIMLVPGLLWGVEVTAELGADKIALDEQVTLTINVSGGQMAGEPELPPVGGLNIYNAGKTFSSTTVNGQTSTAVKYKYVMVPQRTGKLTIGSIKIKVDGKYYQTQPLALEVVQGRAEPGTAGSSKSGQSNATENGEYIIEASINKTTAFEGEMLLYQFRAYQQRGAGFMSDPIYLPPSFSGFWREEFGWKRYSRSIRGEAYVANQMDTYLFPVSPGEVAIEPTRVVVTPDAFSNIFNFDPFSARGIRPRALRDMEPETLQTERLLINVLPLPGEGRPRDFRGAVGSYKMDVSLSGTAVTVDETILLTIKIHGRGNIKTIASPELPQIEGLDIRPSGDTTVIQEAGGVVAGFKTFEYAIIPEQEGVYDIPELRWSYFDPETKNYLTLKSNKYTINISPGAGASGDALAGLLNLPGDLKVRDILGIMPAKTALHKPRPPLILRPAFLAVQAIPLVILGGVVFLRRRQERLMGDVRLRRLKRAHGLAKKRLAEAGGLLAREKYDEFYAAVSRAVYQYIGDKYNFSATGLTESHAAEILSQHGFGEEFIRSLRELVRAADFGRFAPAESSRSTAAALLNQAEEWIVSAENEGRKTK